MRTLSQSTNALKVATTAIIAAAALDAQAAETSPAGAVFLPNAPARLQTQHNLLASPRESDLLGMLGDRCMTQFDKVIQTYSQLPDSLKVGRLDPRRFSADRESELQLLRSGLHGESVGDIVAAFQRAGNNALAIDRQLQCLAAVASDIPRYERRIENSHSPFAEDARASLALLKTSIAGGELENLENLQRRFLLDSGKMALQNMGAALSVGGYSLAAVTLLLFRPRKFAERVREVADRQLGIVGREDDFISSRTTAGIATPLVVPGGIEALAFICARHDSAEAASLFARTRLALFAVTSAGGLIIAGMGGLSGSMGGFLSGMLVAGAAGAFGLYKVFGSSLSARGTKAVAAFREWDNARDAMEASAK